MTALQPPRCSSGSGPWGPVGLSHQSSRRPEDGGLCLKRRGSSAIPVSGVSSGASPRSAGGGPRNDSPAQASSHPGGLQDVLSTGGGGAGVPRRPAEHKPCGNQTPKVSLPVHVPQPVSTGAKEAKLRFRRRRFEYLGPVVLANAPTRRPPFSPCDFYAFFSPPCLVGALVIGCISSPLFLSVGYNCSGSSSCGHRQSWP